MNWALVFAQKGGSIMLHQVPGIKKPVSLSFVVQKEGSKEILPFEEIMVEEPMVEDYPLIKLWKPGDRLYLELGGSNHTLCLQAIARGLEVHRIFSYELRQLVGKVKPAKGELKTSKDRKQRVEMIMQLAQTEPERFYPALELDQRIMRLRVYIDEYVKTQQRLRIPAQNAAYSRQINLGWLPDTKEATHLARVKEGFAGETDINYHLAREHDLLLAIGAELRHVPIWQDYLAGVKGVGPSIGARLIGHVENIRRFPKLGGFRAYCGWSVVDGKAARFRRGKEENGDRVTYSDDLKQALYLFGDQIIRGGAKNPYNATYLRWKQYYAERDPNASKMLVHRRALRAALSDFVDDLWRAWWRLEEARGTVLPQSVRDALV